MIQRFDQIALDLPEPSGPNPATAAAIQELMGGKFGENVNADELTRSSPSFPRQVPFDGMGNPWNGSYVTATGNLKMDLLHNFFLECGARAGKSRVFERSPDPTSRAMCGYLLVRGGVHIVAYAKALEKLTGTPVGGLLPIPDVSN